MQALRRWVKGKDYWDKRKALWERFKDCYEGNEGELDSHVHELISVDATNFNNAGLQTQFDYLCDNAGEDWIEAVLLDTVPTTTTTGR